MALVLAGAGLAFAYRDLLATDSLTTWISGFGALAPLAFILLRIAGAVVLIPGSIMGIVAGAAFGVIPGSVYNLLASTLGAIAAFSIARFIAPAWIHQRLHDRDALRRLIHGVEVEGWRFVAFVRLVPLFPYNFVNYALGLTRISLPHYSLATLICMIPGDVAYVYMGYAAREALAGNRRSWQIGLLALSLLAAVAYLPRIVRRVRKGPDEQTL
jgi:uncharacterized membrane protein YdjX (TVP38/TMEM64 family)